MKNRGRLGHMVTCMTCARDRTAGSVDRREVLPREVREPLGGVPVEAGGVKHRGEAAFFFTDSHSCCSIVSRCTRWPSSLSMRMCARKRVLTPSTQGGREWL